MLKKIFISCTCVLSVCLIRASLSAKSLADYGVHNERLMEVLNEVGLDASVDIDTVFDAEESSLKATHFYGNLVQEINKAENLHETQKLMNVLVTGIDTNARSYVLQRLWKPPYKPDYFSETARQTIINAEKPHAFQADYIRVLGVVGIDNPNINLRRYIEPKPENESAQIGPPGLYGPKFTTPTWAARVVLARRGDEEALEGVLQELSDIEYYRRGTLFEDLGYIRQPETIDILIEALFSDLGTPDNPYPNERWQNHPTTKPYAYYAIQPLALAFDDFPIDYWQFTYFPEDLEKAREYIRNYLNPSEAVEEGPEPVEPEEITTLEPAIEEEPAEVVATEPTEEDVEQSPNWWLWLIGAVVVVGGVFVLRSRK